MAINVETAQAVVKLEKKTRKNPLLHPTVVRERDNLLKSLRRANSRRKGK